MKRTKIRWATSTWSPMVGCTRVSPGCGLALPGQGEGAGCYAETIATKFAGGPAFPEGFRPTFKPQRLDDPRRWRDPAVVFVCAMSDLHHETFTRDQLDQVHDVMAEVDRHEYLILTKRPQRMARYLLGPDGWLARRGLDRVPDHVWLGTSIETDRYVWRADWLRRIPVAIRFVSAEPLLGPLPSLDLGGISWVIIGGESGPGYRRLDHAWARDLRDRCRDAGAAVFVKQDSGGRTELRPEFLGRRVQEYPEARLHHPAVAALVERR